jgi:2-aminoethylphosphonate-pyruvate transaminase
MTERRHEFYLMTPGPVTVSPATKREMLRDRSPNGDEMMGQVSAIRAYLLEICNGTGTHECVPVQGSATFAIEGAFHTLVPKGSRILVIQNGFYGVRLKEIAEGVGHAVTMLELGLTETPTEAMLDAAIDAEPGITHMIMCHVDTGTGILNPLEPLVAVARRRGVKLFVDAVASFGAFPIDVKRQGIEAVMISPNKGLEGVPGVGIVICRRDTLEAAAGRSPSVVLDLHAQWAFMESRGWWRFTPPTHVLAALAQACERHKAEGGVAARGARYRRNWRRLVDGLRQRGFRTLLPDNVAAPIIATFMDPDDPAYDFRKFYAAMERRGIVIFPGRLTAAGTFRIGCMGDIVEDDISVILEAIEDSMAEIGVGRAPAAAGAAS